MPIDEKLPKNLPTSEFDVSTRVWLDGLAGFAGTADGGPVGEQIAGVATGRALRGSGQGGQP